MPKYKINTPKLCSSTQIKASKLLGSLNSSLSELTIRILLIFFSFVCPTSNLIQERKKVNTKNSVNGLTQKVQNLRFLLNRFFTCRTFKNKVWFKVTFSRSMTRIFYNFDLLDTILLCHFVQYFHQPELSC